MITPSADIFNGLQSHLSSGIVFGSPAAWLSFLADVSIKGLVLLLVAGALIYAFRRSAAAVRHTVWTMALVSFLMMPVLSLVMPRWQINILPEVVAGGPGSMVGGKT